MPNFAIKEEALPVRCEICHQTDCFDAQNNRCTRCVDIIHLKTAADDLLAHRTKHYDLATSFIRYQKFILNSKQVSLTILIVAFILKSIGFNTASNFFFISFFTIIGTLLFTDCLINIYRSIKILINSTNLKSRSAELIQTFFYTVLAAYIIYALSSLIR